MQHEGQLTLSQIAEANNHLATKEIEPTAEFIVKAYQLKVKQSLCL